MGYDEYTYRLDGDRAWPALVLGVLLGGVLMLAAGYLAERRWGR